MNKRRVVLHPFLSLPPLGTYISVLLSPMAAVPPHPPLRRGTVFLRPLLSPLPSGVWIRRTRGRSGPQKCSRSLCHWDKVLLGRCYDSAFLAGNRHLVLPATCWTFRRLLLSCFRRSHESQWLLGCSTSFPPADQPNPGSSKTCSLR